MSFELHAGVTEPTLAPAPARARVAAGALTLCVSTLIASEFMPVKP